MDERKRQMQEIDRIEELLEYADKHDGNLMRKDCWFLIHRIKELYGRVYPDAFRVKQNGTRLLRPEVADENRNR